MLNFLPRIGLHVVVIGSEILLEPESLSDRYEVTWPTGNEVVCKYTNMRRDSYARLRILQYILI